MPKESIVIQAVIFASVLFAIISTVFISFIFMYQKRKHRHQQDIQKIEEVFTKEMLNSQIEIKEQTLKEISGEIHDNYITSLSVVNLGLATVVTLIDGAAKENLTDIKQSVRQIMEDMKSLSVSLNTDHIEEAGFLKTFEKYIEKFRAYTHYQVSFIKKGTPYTMEPKKEVILYRMCQEILNNVIKHAKAGSVEVLLDYQPACFTVQISDNGKGFDVDSEKAIAEDKESTGLQNLYKRAAVLNALLQIESKPGKGTVIKISINGIKKIK
jgi:signal transduction histidine kinase